MPIATRSNCCALRRFPSVIAVGWLSATGKTSISRALAGELGLRVVSSDEVRRSLFGDAKRPSRYGEGSYSAEASRLTYQKMCELGRDMLDMDNGVILDATFRRAEDLAAAHEMSEAAGCLQSKSGQGWNNVQPAERDILTRAGKSI